MPLSTDVSRLLVILIGSSGRNFFASFPRFLTSLGLALFFPLAILRIRSDPAISVFALVRVILRDSTRENRTECTTFKIRHTFVERYISSRIVMPRILPELGMLRFFFRDAVFRRQFFFLRFRTRIIYICDKKIKDETESSIFGLIYELKHEAQVSAWKDAGAHLLRQICRTREYATQLLPCRPWKFVGSFTTRETTAISFRRYSICGAFKTRMDVRIEWDISMQSVAILFTILLKIHDSPETLYLQFYKR